jgi:NAD(P)H dehydrogenase (quinone)
MFDKSKPLLVFLASGVQGGAVVRSAIPRGIRVRALLRRPERAHSLAAQGAELAFGDLDDLSSLEAACRGLDHAVVRLPTADGPAMVAQMENVLSAFKVAGVRSFVLALASASRAAPCSEPSFVANGRVEEAARRSGIPFAVVRPTLYLDNLLKPSARTDVVERGIFAPPIPAAQAIAWTSADDCAAAALTLLERGAMGGDHRMAGPYSLTGDELAARLSAGLRRAVRYRGQSVDDFEAEIDQALGAGEGRRVASKFRYFAAHPDEARHILARPFTPQPGLEGFVPTDVESWARRHCDAFTAAEPAASSPR